MRRGVGSSETIRKITDLQVSKHKPRARKPSTTQEIGSFLAGLIDGDGHWSSTPQLVISFHGGESSLAYYIKGIIGYGRVRPVKGKQALIYVLAHRDGLRKVAFLCAPYLRHPDKCAHFDERTVPLLDIPPRTPFNLVNPETSAKLDWWIAGFFVADGSISIRLLERPGRRLEARFLLRVDQKNRQVLDFIKSQLGGSIYQRTKQSTYYYSSISYKNAVNWIYYLDRAFLMGVKMTSYVLWRRAFLLVQEKHHWTPCW